MQRRTHPAYIKIARVKRNLLTARVVSAALAALLTIFSFSATTIATAQETYPSRPITIVVPSPAGNVNDAVARLIGQELTKVWNQPIVIENKAGAGTTTGTNYVARGPKDGYTVLLTFTAHVQNPSLYSALGYDPIKDFEPVSEVAASSVILAVSPDYPYKTLPEIVKQIKASSTPVPYGSYGNGTTGHLMGELFVREVGLNMDHVAYKGGAPLATDLAAGHVKIGFIAVGTAMPLLSAKKIIPVAIAGEKRSDLMPEVPTFLELGYKGFEPEAWMGLLFPAGVPKDRVAALSKEVARIVRIPEIDKRMRELNLVPIGNTPEQFAKVIQDDYQKWAAIIKQAGIKLD